MWVTLVAMAAVWNTSANNNAVTNARIRQVLLIVPGAFAERHERAAHAGHARRDGCVDDSGAHKSQILRVSRVNPMSGEVIAVNASLLSVYGQHREQNESGS